MLYAMSDIHGEYEKYLRMLEKIHFSKTDTLYILGDALDRGPAPIPLLQDIAGRENVIFLLGNHESMALEMLEKLNVEITEENAHSHLDGAFMRSLLAWQQEGGETTLRGFSRLSADEKSDLIDFLQDAPLYETAEAGGKEYLLLHGGLGNFRPGKRLREYSPEEILWARPDYNRAYFPDPSLFIVSGHTPTLAVTGRAEIYHSHRNLLIDCGAAFGGRLACLCLDTLECFYT